MNPSVVRTFDLVSRVYNQPLVQRIGYRPNHDAVLAELHRMEPRRVLDVGCGTGILTARIATELAPEAVIGCDPSAGMLDKARQRSGGVRWLAGSAEQLPLADGAVDTLVTTEAFHFFDQPAALAEFHRVLAPGGHVVIAVVTPHVSTMSVLGDRGPARWPTRAEQRAMLRDAGFDVVAQRPVRPRMGPLSLGVATVGRRDAARDPA